jgi:hypothetical protein
LASAGCRGAEDKAKGTGQKAKVRNELTLAIY